MFSRRCFSRVLLALCAVAVNARAAPAADGSAGDKREWLILERRNAHPPEIVSVLAIFPDPEVRGRYPVLLRVIWNYAALANGMPTEEEIVRGRVLYANLDRIIGQGGVFAMSRTGAGCRTMYYYVASAEAHANAIRQYFDSLPPISVEVIKRAEPGWDSIREVLDGLR